MCSAIPNNRLFLCQSQKRLTCAPLGTRCQSSQQVCWLSSRQLGEMSNSDESLTPVCHQESFVPATRHQTQPWRFERSRHLAAIPGPTPRRRFHLIRQSSPTLGVTVLRGWLEFRAIPLGAICGRLSVAGISRTNTCSNPRRLGYLRAKHHKGGQWLHHRLHRAYVGYREMEDSPLCNLRPANPVSVVRLPR